MIASLRRMLAIVACALVAPVASASVLTFDDLVGGPHFFVQNYQGFQFGDNSPATNPWFYTDEVSPSYVPHSGTHYVATDYTLYNGGPANPTLPISRATPFVFNGAYFSGDGPVYYQLFLGNLLVFTSITSPTFPGTSSFVASGYAGNVDSVVIVGHQGFYAMDDFTYNATATAGVPEPATLLLLALGLVGMSVIARRRRR